MIKINNQIKIIGVTGNIGSGKSTICEILKSFGGYLISADKISHEIIMSLSPVYTELIKNFGVDILQDNSFEIDRKKLAEKVFNDSTQLQKLNEITHPHIIKAIINEIKAFYFEQENYKYIVIEAPLLIETQLNKICDETWLIFADDDVKIKRLMQRDNLSKKEIENRLKYQLSFEDAKHHADKIIVNNGGREELQNEVEKMLTCFV